MTGSTAQAEDTQAETPLPDTAVGEEELAEETPRSRIYRWVEILSASMLALATIATAWSGYQSARWGGEQTRSANQATEAIIRSAKFANLAEQKIGAHITLFGQWAAAVSAGDTVLAEFAFNRFPEPLKTAATAWRATEPLTNPAAPATPFEMPEYALAETAEAQRWESVATEAFSAAETANEISDRYLLFTLIFASVLFFGGISGKFRWQALDIAVLVIGALVLLAGVAMLLISPML